MDSPTLAILKSGWTECWARVQIKLEKYENYRVKTQLLVPGWNAVSMLKTYPTMIPYTHNLQPQAHANRQQRVEQSGNTLARLC